ncbi:glycoside hydrolase family 97 C-terminal domain-containing protein [Spirillospora sp. CA-255316]
MRAVIRVGEQRALHGTYMGANGNPPVQATILPFTWFMGGPADYMPGVLNVTWDPARLGTRVQTTSAQLALCPTFFSPPQMPADTPENYAAHPGFAFLKDLPGSWDETRVLDSALGDYTATARRKGDTWYLGAITDENDRTLQVPLSFLPHGTFVAETYDDAQETTWKGDPLPVEIRRTLVRSSTRLSMSLVGVGGQAVRIRPATAAEVGDLPWYTPPRAVHGTPEAVLGPGNPAAHREGSAHPQGQHRGRTPGPRVPRRSCRQRGAARPRRGRRDPDRRVDAARRGGSRPGLPGRGGRARRRTR